MGGRRGITMKAYQFSRICLELDIEEGNQLYDAISRVLNKTDQDTIDKFADQDKMIFTKVIKVIEESGEDR